MKAINPATNELLKEYREHSAAEVNTIIDLVDNEQNKWKATDFALRSDLVRKAAAVLRKNKDEYARLMTMEMGKPIKEARSEVDKCAWVCDYYAENAHKFLSDEIIESDAGQSFVAFEPLGIILAVMPWNFPFWQVFRFAAPALMAGNAGILKHASNVPGSALAIERVFHEAGFPENIFRTMLVGSGAVDSLIKDDRVRAVTLTGSEPAGMAVASCAGSQLKKMVLELGGSDCFIVLDDADMETCIPVSVTSRIINAGQSCIAAKRFIVVKSKLKEFEEKHAVLMNQLKIGNPLEETTQVGPLARPDLVAELDDQVQRSIRQGARVLLGGHPKEGPGAYYLPTVLTDVKKGMAVYSEETFGPVSVIIPVKDETEAIEVANDSEFGLGGAVWTADAERGIRVARQIYTGAIFVNGLCKSDPRLPFGGVKKSGYGRELSHYGIREFVNIKTIWAK
ncbi:MAG: NAD-dependent succinate-semialdehyde dehydrogenase [Candidatus Zixiibacteriota bacterium]